MKRVNNEDNNNKQGGGVLAACMITSMVTTFMGSALNLSVPALEKYFGINAGLVGWIVSGYTIAVAAMCIPFGRMADIIDKKKIFIGGIIIFSAASILCIVSPNFTVMMVFRVLQGIAAAMIFATNNAILISYYPSSVRGKMLGFSLAATYIGLTAGPVLGGMLDSLLGWKSIFIATAVIGAVAIWVSVRAVPAMESDQNDGSGFDIKGSLLYILGISLTLYGLTDVVSSTGARVMLAAGLLLIVIFFAAEARTEAPVLKVSLFKRSREFTFSNLAALLNYAATFAISYLLSLYLQLVHGYSSGKAGLILIMMPAMQALFSPLMGRLSDSIRPSVLASSGMGICVVSLVMYSRLGTGTGIGYVIATMCITGVSFAMFSSPNTNAIMSCVGHEDYGIASSVVAMMRMCGQSAGMAIVNIVVAAVIGSGTLESTSKLKIILTMRSAFIVFAVLCVIGLIFSMLRDRKADQ